MFNHSLKYHLPRHAESRSHREQCGVDCTAFVMHFMAYKFVIIFNKKGLQTLNHQPLATSEG